MNFDFELFMWNFEGFSQTMFLIWMPMQLAGLFVVYYAFKLWAVCRVATTTRSRLVDMLFLALFIGYLGLFLLLPLQVLYQVSISCRLIILLEQVSLMTNLYFTCCLSFKYSKMIVLHKKRCEF
jgi:hypothetical protein